MSRLQFSRNDHRYLLDGKRVPTVTGITGKALDKPGMVKAAAREAALWANLHRDAHDVMGDTAWIDTAAGAHREVWNRARDDGSMLHVLAESLIYGTLMPEDVDGVRVPEHVADMAEQLAGFFDAWQVQPVLHETKVYHADYRYAGTFDLVADFGGKRWLLDYKTSASGVWPENALQLAGYRHATHYVDRDNVDQRMTDLGIDDTAVVWVRPSFWEVVPVVTDASQFRAFLHCGAVADWAGKARGASVLDALPKPEQAAS